MSNFSISRNQNGQAQITMNSVKNKQIDGVGNLTGSATFTVGNTGQKSNETVVQIGQTKDDDALLIAVDDDIDNIELYGTNLEACFDSKETEQYNVQWDAKNSVLNSSEGNASLLITTNELSDNNMFILGQASSSQALFADSNVDNMIVDNGSNNTFISSENSANYFETTETSKNAQIYGGNGDNTFVIGGNNAFVVGGDGNDYFVTGQLSDNNMLFGMDGNDYLQDFGNRNFFGGGKGFDSVSVNGKNGLYNLGKNEDYNAAINGGSNNAVFSTDSITDNNGNIYSYEEYIEQYLDDVGMTLAEFKEKAGLSEAVSLKEIYQAMIME